MMVITNVFPKLQTMKNFVRPLCKTRRFGTRFDSQHMRVSQISAKSPSEHFYHVFSSIWGKLIWKMFPVLLGEVLEKFLNKGTAESKYSIEDWENLQLPTPVLLGEILVTFLNKVTAEGKYPILDWENLPLPIQTHFSEKLKTFS